MNFITTMYEENPEYFIDKINDKPDFVLLNILKLYKKKF